MKIAYVRVSTEEQNTNRQTEALKSYNIDKWFIEKVSGKDTNRPKLKELLNFVREGDTVYVVDWSRLSRSVVDLLKIVELLNNTGCQLISLKEQFDTKSPTGKLMMNLIASINEFERENLLLRQKEGIAVAKQKGVYKGRKPKEFDPQYLNSVLTAVKNKQMTVVRAAELLGVSRATVYNLLDRQNGH